MIEVTFIMRESRKTGFSIEGIFDVVRKCLKSDISDSEYKLNPAKSRLWNIFNIAKLPDDRIYHITGDVHFLAMGLSGKKSVITVHDLAHYEHLKKSPVKFWLYHYFWFYFPLKKVTLVTTVSQDTKEKLIANFPFVRNKIRVVYNPIKPVFKFNSNEHINAVPRILQIGTGAHKNLNNLIEAARGSGYCLDIVALPDEKCINKLKEYNIPYTISSGLTDEQLYEKYKACDVVFFASFHEGFGMPIVEAQAIGRPVITSNRGAMLEVAKDSAITVDPHNVDEIRAALDMVLGNKAYYDSVVEKGIANSADYNSNKIAQDYLKVYKELAQTPDKSIVYLYSEVMPYAITIMRALRDYFNVNIYCVCWDEKKMTPFVPRDLDRIKFYKRSSFDKQSLVDFIKARQPEAIFISGRMDGLYLKVARHFRQEGVPVISACDNQWYGTIKNKAAVLFSKFVYHRYFDYFWVPGRRQFEFVKRVGYPSHRIIGYSLSADVDCFKKAYEEKIATKSKFPRSIVFAGRFVENKGINTLVRAFTEFKAETNSAWKLIIVGEGNLPIKGTNDIEIKGFMTTEELAAASTEWGVFCLPSLWEPWGVVIHEFVAAGMPVIASDHVGAADTFVINNYNGFIFEAGNARSLKNVLHALNTKKDEELWMMSRRSVEMSNAITPAKSAYSFMSAVRKHAAK